MNDLPLQDEPQRLLALEAYGLLDTPPEPEYDDLTHLAATICDAPIALVSLIDSCRQWFKSKHGLDVCETPRDIAFCSHTIQQSTLFEVPNATIDPRFRDNPLVKKDPKIRFYAGMPLSTPEGHNVGTLCVIDRKPRRLTETQKNALRVLARQVVTQMTLRKQCIELEKNIAERKQTENALWESEQRFRAFIDNSPVIAFLKEESGKYTFVNQPVEKRFGKPAHAWLNHTDEELFPNEFTAVMRAHDAQVLAGNVVVEFEEIVPTEDGTLSYWTTYKFPFEDSTGKRYLAGLGLDVTDKRQIENELRASERKFRAVVDRLAEGVFVVNPQSGRIVEANSALSQMVGYSLAELQEKGLFQIVHGESKEIFEQNIKAIHKQLALEGKCDLGRKWFRRKNGVIVPVELRIAVVPNREKELHIFIVRDISERVENENRLYEYQNHLERANCKLKELATTDSLTKVFNRAAFNEKITEEWDRAMRYNHPLSLLLIDVDYFKLFNDTYGHLAGDEVLKNIAQILQFNIRSCDMVARYGGEEFAIILPDTDLSGAMVIAERCRQAIEEAKWNKRIITVSIGMSACSKSIADPASMIADADLGLFRSKQAGRNKVSRSRESSIVEVDDIMLPAPVSIVG